MGKAFASFIATVVAGYWGTMFGHDVLNWPQFGTILAIAVTGFAMIASLEKNK